jgi:hypothetical protein
MYNCIEEQPGRRRVTHRGADKNQRDMQDILNVFLEQPLHAIPLFVCKDLTNLPPLTMNNFDMASIIKNIETLQTQVSILTESHEKSVKSQASLCEHLMTNGPKPSYSEVTRPKAHTLHVQKTAAVPNMNNIIITPVRDTNDDGHVHSSMFSDDGNDTHSNKEDQSDSDGDDRDLIRLAAIQNRPARRTHKTKKAAPQIQHETTGRGKRDVIIGNGTFTHVRAAKDRRATKQRECTGIFNSRIARATRAHHVSKHIEKKEANIHAHCEEIPAKYDNCDYRSFYVRLNTRDQRTLMNPTMWPRGAIIRGYFD